MLSKTETVILEYFWPLILILLVILHAVSFNCVILAQERR